MMSFIAFMFQEGTDNAPSNALAAGIGATAGLIGLIIGLIMIISLWKIFVKAGKPGWAAIIPIYNLIVLLEICGKPIWWFILFLIPLVNIIVAIILTLALAAKFGKGVGFAIGLMILPIIFYPILGFGNAQYNPAG